MIIIINICLNALTNMQKSPWICLNRSYTFRGKHHGRRRKYREKKKRFGVWLKTRKKENYEKYKAIRP